MKKYILLLAMVVPLLGNGQTYFKDGTKWLTQISSTHTPDGFISIETVTIDGEDTVDGQTVMKMYCSYEGDVVSDRTLKAFIRTEGDRVYFKNTGRTDSQWYLLYDFGLNVGEGCYVYNPNTDEPYKTYVKCVAMGRDSDNSGWDILTLEEYSSDLCESFLGSGLWIKGLSSVGGVLGNNLFDSDGVSSVLLSAETDCEGTVYPAGIPASVKMTGSSLRIEVNGLTVSILNIDEAGDVSLYSEDGTILRRSDASSIGVRWDLPSKGVYIIKVGDNVQKIMAF